jgi:hypothetical protein
MHPRTTSARMTIDHSRPRRLPLLGVFSLLILLCMPPRAGQSQDAVPQLGTLDIQLLNTDLVPGSLLDVRYQTSPGTLQGPVDIYFAVTVPPEQTLLFLQEDGSLSTTVAPFRRNVTVAEETTLLFRGHLVWIPFGTYACYMALVHAGISVDAENAFASGIAWAVFSFQPLSAAQSAIIQERGNPDLLTTTWVDEIQEKRDVWLYVSGTPTQYTFVNGDLESQRTVDALSGGTPPKVDPSLFTAQTTLDQLTAALGPPTSVENVEGTGAYQTATFSLGLTATFYQGYLVTVSTYSP